MRFWKKKKSLPEDTPPTLYQQIFKIEQSSLQDVPQYPPVTAGIPLAGLKEILLPQKKLLKQIDDATETMDVFERRYWPAIERYAGTVHLLPASEHHHHSRAGGLLHHGLETGLFALQFGKGVIYGKHLFEKKRDGRERWLYACFLAGLCHDLGKVAINMRVTSENGRRIWSPYVEYLIDWAKRNETSKYYVYWQQVGHKEHERFTWSLLDRVVSFEDRKYLGEIDSGLVGQFIQAVSVGCDWISQSGRRPFNMAELVQKADKRSVAEDRRQSRLPGDMAPDVPRPLIRHYRDGLYRLLREWDINNPGGAVWVLGREQQFFLVWPRCGKELFDLLSHDGVPVPADPWIIADVLAEYDLLVPSAAGNLFWQIKPANLDDATLIAVRINDVWLPTLIDLLPPGINGFVRPHDGGSAWTEIA